MKVRTSQTSGKLLAALSLCILWAAMTFVSGGFLRRIEANDFFLLTSSFFVGKVSTPGGLLAYVSAFLTQFMHQPWLGAMILTLIYALLADSCRRAYQIREEQISLTLVPVLLLVAALMHTGYMVFKLKYQSMAFVPAIGCLGITAAVMIIRKAYENHRECLLTILWTLLAYPLLGFFALAGTLSSLVMLMEQDMGKNRRCTDLSAAVLSVAAIPPLWYCFIGKGRMANAWTVMLPAFPAGSGFSYTLPYLLLALWFVFMPVIAGAAGRKRFRTAVLVLSVLFTVTFWCKDPNFRAETEMSAALERSDWEKIIRIYRNATKWKWSESTRLMVMYKDLAMQKTGREGDMAFTLRDGMREQRCAVSIPLTVQAGKQFYLHYGIPNYSYRWAFETYAETGWSYESMKYAAASSILSGNYGTAGKFLAILDETLFYRKWAERQRSLIENPALLEESEEYGGIIPLLCDDNWLDNDMSLLEDFIDGLYVDRIPENATHEHWRTSLFFAAKECNIGMFGEFYQRFIATAGPDRIPTHWQEAIILFSGLTNEFSTTKFPFDEEVRASYAAYRKFMEHNRDMNEPTEEFRRYFGRTYYYYWYTHTQR